MVAILNQKIPVFQSTLPREERLFGFGIRVIISIFQSTLPREERRYPHGLQSLLFHNFNPRSHERSDIPAGSFHCCLHYISIHAPTRGATVVCSIFDTIFTFQSTLPREERPLWPVCNIYQLYFNPRSHERSDVLVRSAFCLSCISIHAPTRGATRSCSRYLTRDRFQSTLPREERQ